MQLVLDIGNSSVVVGVYHDGLLSHVWRLDSVVSGGINPYKEQIARLLLEANVAVSDISLVIVSSVVPSLTEPFRKFLQNFFDCQVVVLGPDVYALLDLQIDRPREIGSDLVANAYAAHKRYQQDCIIVDFGTALTITAVDTQPRICGVSIAPGIRTALKSLMLNTAQLPEVPLDIPESVLGVNTVTAIQSGVLTGYVGLVEKLVTEYQKQWSPRAIVVVTGGMNHVLYPLRHLIHEMYPNLTMDGVRDIGLIAFSSSGDQTR